MIVKLSKSFLGRVRPQTEADSEIQPKLERQAPTCGNAMLPAGVFLVTSFWHSDRQSNGNIFFQCHFFKSLFKAITYPK